MSTAAQTAITNVRVFDGQRIGQPRTVLIEGGVIASGDPRGDAVVVDAHGGTLLPGFIDTHVHLIARSDLDRAAWWGVTTVMDMGSPSMAQTDLLRADRGIPTVLGSGPPASAPGGIHTTVMRFPLLTAVAGPADAARFVADRVAEGADYIKVIVEDPARVPAALSVETIAALVAAAHDAGLTVIAHAPAAAAVAAAVEARVDVITHVPLDTELDAATLAGFAAAGIVAVPTLVMMRTMGSPEVVAAIAAPPGSRSFAPALASVTGLHASGVEVLVGTDANTAPFTPAPVAHGSSLHDELALLVEAGLTPLDALRGATVLAARFFGLGDRGAIEPGMRADLVLIDGDPLADIAATRQVRDVWIAGERIRRPSRPPRVAPKLVRLLSVVRLGMRAKRVPPSRG